MSGEFHAEHEEMTLDMSAAHQPAEFDYTPMVRLIARLTRVAEQACQSTGISLPQYRLLGSLADGPQRASALHRASRAAARAPAAPGLRRADS